MLTEKFPPGRSSSTNGIGQSFHWFLAVWQVITHRHCGAGVRDFFLWLLVSVVSGTIPQLEQSVTLNRHIGYWSYLPTQHWHKSNRCTLAYNEWQAIRGRRRSKHKKRHSHVFKLGPKKYQKIARMYDRTGLSTKCTLIKIDLFRHSDPNSDLFRPFV